MERAKVDMGKFKFTFIFVFLLARNELNANYTSKGGLSFIDKIPQNNLVTNSLYPLIRIPSNRML